jgi:hypothetical protein
MHLRTVAGALVALLLTRLAISLGLSTFILKGDSLIIITAVQLPIITQDLRIACDYHFHYLLYHFINY